jgi:glycosyltransferase involved in cell wall biosynthesis
MKIAYLIDRDVLGGGMTYIYRKISEHSNDDCQIFFSEKGECTATAMNDWGAEIIYVNHLRALLQLYRNPFVRPHGRVIFVVHGIHLRKFDFLPKTFSNQLKRYLRLCLESILYRKCDTLIALTEIDATDIHKLYGTDLRIIVEPNSLDVSSLRLAEDLRFEVDQFAFVSIARFDFAKGLDILIKAIALAQNRFRQIGATVLMIGSGPTFEDIKQLVNTSGISDLVVFTGEIKDAGVYMMCGRTLVSSSRWEGMPYLLLEAVARNRRVIASDCSGNKAVVDGYALAKTFAVENVKELSELMIESCMDKKQVFETK